MRYAFAAAAFVATSVVIPPAVQTGAQSHMRYEPAPAGNEARYRVREQLAGFDFPSDAVGVTTNITGAIVLDATGKVVPDQSKFVINLTGLKSDQTRRDRYIQSRTMETQTHPNVELLIKELRGLPHPLPASGELKVELIGDLTVKGITKPTTWQVTAAPTAGGLAGLARTQFTFADFNLTKPRVASVLSVNDEITLEYEFHLIPKPKG
jgi:polyisoprenoid-binding protein YceI